MEHVVRAARQPEAEGRVRQHPQVAHLLQQPSNGGRVRRGRFLGRALRRLLGPQPRRQSLVSFFYILYRPYTVYDILLFYNYCPHSIWFHFSILFRCFRALNMKQN